MRRYVLLAFLLCSACGPRPVWMFAGDSNTHYLPCAYPKLLQQRHPAVRLFDEGMFGSRAVDWLAKGSLLTALERDQPDRVLIVLGTNDLLSGGQAAHLIETLAALYAEVDHHIRPDGTRSLPYVATIPPLVVPPSPGRPTSAEVAAVSPQLSQLNQLIRGRFPRARVVDFDSWMPASWDAAFMLAATDGIHMGCRTHVIRADVIDAIP